MESIYSIINKFSEASFAMDRSVQGLIHTTDLKKAKAEAVFQGTSGAWRRVGGHNLFLREGDGVIMNGPLALRGQPMSNITADDFRAIPKVKQIHARHGNDAVPGDDIMETSSGVSLTTLDAGYAQALVTKSFNKVIVVVKKKVSEGRYEVVDEKSFAGKDELADFENAKAWARKKLRSKAVRRAGKA